MVKGGVSSKKKKKKKLKPPNLIWACFMSDFKMAKITFFIFKITGKYVFNPSKLKFNDRKIA